MSDSLHIHKPDHGHAHGHSCCASKAAPSVVNLGKAPTDGARLSSFRIEAMDCPTEQTLIQNKLGKLEGVQQLEFNLINRVLGVTHDLPSDALIIKAIESLGMQADPLTAGEKPETNNLPAPAKPWWPLALSGVTALAAEVIHFTNAAPNWAVALVALVSILSGGVGTYKKGWIALKNFNLNINALMSIAVTGAVLIGQWPEAAMVMFRGRADRSQIPRPGTQRHQRPDANGAGTSHGATGRRHLADSRCEDHCPGCKGAGSSRRTGWAGR
jgi:Cd2+/Zn2+-exporting ATPase